MRSISTAGVITTLAGAGVEGQSADGANGMQASLRAPRALAVSAFGQPVIGDTLNGTVWVLTAAGTLYRPAALVGARTSSLQPALALTQTYGQVNGAVTAGGAVGTPEGTLIVSEAGQTLTIAALQNGHASFSLPGLDAGTHTLSIGYSGDGLNPAATSNTVALNVSPAPVVATATSVSIRYGEGLPTISGTISGVLPPDAGQVSATFTAPPGAATGVGSYPLQVELTGPKSGDYVVSVAAGSGTLQVVQAGSAVTLSNIGQGYAGVPLRLTASVLSTTSGKPTGTVQFLDGGAVVATASVVNGSASALYNAPPAGLRNITAQYSGDTNFEASNSTTEVATVSPLPDFSVGVAGASAASVAAGSIAAYNLTVSSQSGPFTGVVTLSASGLPAGATAVFAPVQVVPGASVATVAVSVQTSAPQALLRSPFGSGKGTLWAVAGFVFCGAWMRRRRGRLAALLGASLLVCGCGARTVGEGVNGAISQTYTVQLTGTSTNLLGAVVTHNTAVMLTVQN